VLADGMGGSASGREAAEIAARSSLDVIRRHEATTWSDTLTSALAAAHQAVVAVREARVGDYRGMGATAVIAVVEPGDVTPLLHVAHVGDSRAYLYRGTSLIRLTRDHSLVRRLVEEGLLTEEAAIGHPDCNVVLRAIGQFDPFEAEVQVPIPLDIGDLVVLTTDGLHGVVEDGEIQDRISAASSPLEVCANLIHAALAAQSQDNITVGCIKVATNGLSGRRSTRIEM
jgi:PPM family protein phosphatase